MRKSDIWQAKQNPSYVRTESMYIDKDKPIEQMDLDELRRALCGKANGDVLACEKCEARCKFGRRIVELLQPVAMEHDAKHLYNVARGKIAGKRSGEARRKKKGKNYFLAIASGDPVAWFKEAGMEPKNAMRRLKEYDGITQQEAVKRLRAMGVEPPEPLRVTQEKPKEEAKPQAPTPAMHTALRISAVQGDYFAYCIENGLLTLNAGDCKVRVKLDNVDAMCDEIQQAARMMGGAV